MKRFVVFVLFACLLTGCQGAGMKVMSATQEEIILLAYQDNKDKRGVHGTSTSGEAFSGSLLWTKDQVSSGKYSGVIVGESGRTLHVSLGCNAHKQACAGTAKDDDGSFYYVF